MKKKKILAFNDYYIPATDVGGPVTSISNAVKALSDDFDFYIEAYNHNFSDKKPFENIEVGKAYNVGDAVVYYHPDGYLDYNYSRMEVFIKMVDPDIMWFSGLLMPNKLHNAIKIGEKHNIPVVISPRGEASPDRMCIKGYKKYPYAFLMKLYGLYRKKNVYFHVTSNDEIEGLVKYFGIDEARITLVPNIGVVASPRDKNYKKEKDKLRIVFLSRIHEVKNLLFAIEIVKKLKCEAVFDIYGPIESKNYWQKCQYAIVNAPSNVKINYRGKVNPGAVGDVFRRYDCFLFPTINENYGHVIAESLANGCPVILSKGTTPWDDLDGIAGYVCDLRNVDQYVEVLEELSSFNDECYSNLSISTIDYYRLKSEDDCAVLGHRKMFDSIILLKD